MLRHFINTIDYKKLIEMQANQSQTRIDIKTSKSLKTDTKFNGKVKKYNLYSNRHK